MEAQTPTTHLHQYMGKAHNIKLDIVTRQAIVSPIFRKPSIPPIAERYVKVFDPVINDLESQSDENYLLKTKLYDKYKTVFNNISTETLIDINKDKRESDAEPENNGSSTHNSEDSTVDNLKRQRLNTQSPVQSESSHKRSKTEEIFVRPWISHLPLIVKSMYQLSQSKDGSFYRFNREPTYKIHYKNADYDDSFAYVKTPDRVDTLSNQETAASSASSASDAEPESVTISYKYVKNLTYALITFVNCVDDWNHRAHDSLSRTGQDRITLSEAKQLMEEFHEFSCGMLGLEAADRLEQEIQNTEKYRSDIRGRLLSIFGKSKKNTEDLLLVERFLKQGFNTAFITPEYLTLNQLFYNISSLRHLIVDSVFQQDLASCSSLIRECDKYTLKIPNINKLKSHVSKLMWLNQAQKCTQKVVNYTVVEDLIETAPSELKKSQVYKELKQRLKIALEWIDGVNDPKFNRIILFESIKTNKLHDKQPDKPKNESDSYTDTLKNDISKDIGAQKDTTNGSKGKFTAGIDQKLKAIKIKAEGEIFKNVDKFTPDELEAAFNSYQKIELIIPNFRNIEHVYHMWKRFQRKLKRLETLLSSDSKVNCTIESLVLLEQAESLIEYVEITPLLEPIRIGVDLSLNYERKCRNVLNKFNNWSITSDLVKLKIDWNSLFNFKRNTNVNTNDLMDVINIVKLYVNHVNGYADQAIATSDDSLKTHLVGSVNSSGSSDLKSESEDETNPNQLNDSDLHAVEEPNKSLDVNGDTPTNNDVSVDGTVESMNLDDHIPNSSTDNSSNVPTYDQTLSSKDREPMCVESPIKRSDSFCNSSELNRLDFGELIELNNEFYDLAVKNWQIFRNIEDIYKIGSELKEKVNSTISHIKEGLRTDEVVSNLILLSLETVRFGADLNLESELLKALKYCVWSKKLYGLFDKLRKLGNSEPNGANLKDKTESDDSYDKLEFNFDNLSQLDDMLKKLASEPESEGFMDYIDTQNTIARHLNINSHINGDQHENLNSQKDMNVDNDSKHKNLNDMDTQTNSNISNKHLEMYNKLFSLTELEIVNKFTQSQTL